MRLVVHHNDVDMRAAFGKRPLVTFEVRTRGSYTNIVDCTAISGGRLGIGIWDVTLRWVLNYYLPIGVGITAWCPGRQPGWGGLNSNKDIQTLTCQAYTHITTHIHAHIHAYTQGAYTHIGQAHTHTCIQAGRQAGRQAYIHT